MPRIQFKISLTIASMLIVCSISIGILLSVFFIGSRAADQAAERIFDRVSDNVDNEVNALLNRALDLSALMAVNDRFRAVSGNALGVDALGQAFTILKQSKEIYSLYVGDQSGGFLQVIAPRGDAKILKKHGAPDDTEWIVRSIYKTLLGERVQQWSFLNDQGLLIESVKEDNVNYDPRKRPWFKASSGQDRPVLSDIYVFNSLQQPGITASMKRTNADGSLEIVGIDVTLDGLNKFMATQTFSENGFAILYDREKRYIAGVFGESDKVKPLSSITDLVLEDRGGDYYTKEGVLYEGGPGITLKMGAPVQDFRQAFKEMQERIFAICIFGLIIFIPVSYYFSYRVTLRLVRLARNTKELKEFLNLEGPSGQEDGALYRTSRIQEFFDLENSFDHMRTSLVHKSMALGETENKLSRLVELGIAMSAERETETVMEMLLKGAKELSGADGGTLYLIENSALSFKIVQNTSLGIAMGGTSGQEPTLQPVALYNEAGDENHKNVVSHAVHEAESVNIEDAYDNAEFDFSGTKMFDESAGYRSQSFLTVPLKPRGGDVIGALQLINAQDTFGEIQPFNDEIQRFVEALAAQAATVIYNRSLIDAQERLLDSMIHLIAGAIDAKSPYTGGHCNRVPELAIMLAKEACTRTDGIFADFNFQTEEEWREFSIGAWLHDCGKVVTPEYVVDKSTKLETIFNRIHEVRTRFEVLLRDAEISYYKALYEGGDENTLKGSYEARKAQLLDDFAFVAECNVGGEYFGEEKIARLKEIAETRWIRHFDIRLGLSHEEELVYEGVEEPPVEEKLLDDKPYHILPRPAGMAQQFETLGFKVNIPEHLYNRGEVYNLSVSRGTLTEEERFKINEHVMQTIAMLEALPFPPHLQRVPEYAGTHHETMIGTGYPRKLAADGLSVPARIMAVADIFEALTASDRPYKKAKTLSEAVKILSFFKKDEHIDGEIFDLFLTSGVYKVYAERFLLPDQLDDVDISQYLS